MIAIEHAAVTVEWWTALLALAGISLGIYGVLRKGEDRRVTKIAEGVARSVVENELEGFKGALERLTVIEARLHNGLFDTVKDISIELRQMGDLMHEIRGGLNALRESGILPDRRT